MRNLKLTLCYDGTNYHGWQIQPGLKTVQGEVTRAIKEIFKEDAAVYGSSRTDAGVHAKEYVCNFKTSGRIPENKVPSALNTKLPCDIRVLSCSEEKCKKQNLQIYCNGQIRCFYEKLQMVFSV